MGNVIENEDGSYGSDDRTSEIRLGLSQCRCFVGSNIRQRGAAFKHRRHQEFFKLDDGEMLTKTATRKYNHAPTHHIVALKASWAVANDNRLCDALHPKGG